MSNASPSAEADATANLAVCTLQGDDDAPCGRPVAPGAPIPICEPHALTTYRYVRAQLADRAPARATGRLLGTMTVADLDEIAPAGAPVVYYLWSGRLIKIGTTTVLSNRMRAYPPESELLVLEPGGRDVEIRRHRQFTALRAWNEYFHPAAELLTHIEGLRRATTNAVPPARSRQQSAERAARVLLNRIQRPA